jgi:hypothetical protein
MAKRWVPQPNVPVEPSEQVGRRLFNAPELVGADDQVRPPQQLDYRHFEERRDPGEISLDRLGRANVEKKVRDYLIPKAEYAGTTFHTPQSFDAWATLTARALENPPKGSVKFPIIVSPQRPDEPEHIAHNPYHAHVCRPAGHDCHSTALHLKFLFERGKIVPNPYRARGFAAVCAAVVRIARAIGHALR